MMDGEAVRFCSLVDCETGTAAGALSMFRTHCKLSMACYWIFNFRSMECKDELDKFGRPWVLICAGHDCSVVRLKECDCQE